MKLVKTLTNCLHNLSITQSVVNTNNENTGYLAVSVVPGGTTDNDTGLPVPRVKLADTAAGQVYGVAATFNAATQRCGVITKGIVPVKKNAPSVAADIGRGILADSTTAGQVAVAGSARIGSGTVVGRVSDTSPILFVDLGAPNNPVA